MSSFTMSSAYEASMYRKGESSDAQTSWLSLFLIDLLKLLICAAVHICGVVVATLAAVEHTNPDITLTFGTNTIILSQTSSLTTLSMSMNLDVIKG
ncbi:hypothetical protein PENNAL_c0146G10759 [Penicillium nalgiovense]|uniref:Uncharacterized protein n=1 Tax=Penicillium nalgiovense TaxID=60175 RepID=A0A1V6X117_PENNA|nr:hypothetical protein PENNAL_c0146G10759 [Penicillium nalgiovense]